MSSNCGHFHLNYVAGKVLDNTQTLEACEYKETGFLVVMATKVILHVAASYLHADRILQAPKKAATPPAATTPAASSAAATAPATYAHTLPPIHPQQRRVVLLHPVQSTLALP